MRESPDPIGSLKEIALEYHDLGLSVIPLQYAGKRPTFSWKRFQEERADPVELEDWFSRKANIGIVTGKVSNIVVIDCDSQESLHWVFKHCSTTPMMTKTASGFHCYFRHPGNIVKNGVKLKNLPLDVRGDGGYVVAPPSVHETGIVYERLGYWSIEDLPVFDPSWVAPTVRHFPVPTAPVSDDTLKRARAYLAKIEGAVSGNRGHNKTFRVACILTQQFGLGIDDAMALIREWNHKCEPPWSEKELLHKVEDAFRKRYQSVIDGNG